MRMRLRGARGVGMLALRSATAGQGAEHFRIEPNGSSRTSWGIQAASAFRSFVSQVLANRTICGLFAIPVILPLTAGSAFAQLQDSGFDTQGASVSQYCYDCPTGAWTLDGNAGFVRQGNTNWPAPIPKSTPIVAFIQWQGAISQAFTATETRVVRLSFWTSGRSGSRGDQTVNVSVNGVQIDSAETVTGEPWKKFVSVPFNVTAGQSYVVRLAGTATTDNASFVDNVQIVGGQSTVVYTYDALGRLIKTDTTGGANGGEADSFCYDAAGNRTTYKSNAEGSLASCVQQGAIQ